MSDPAGAVILRAANLRKICPVHGFSTRRGGVSDGAFASLNVSYDVGDEAPRVAENRRRLAYHAGFDPSRLMEMRQEHSDRVIVLPGDGQAPAGLRGDALVATGAGWVLGVRTADCLPVLLADRHRRAVAAAHAGWRGTLAGITARTVEALARLGCAPAELQVALGPCIRACCYSVGEEVAERFLRQFGPEALRRDEAGRGYVDLAAANRWQLLAAGVPAGAIEDLGLCTACRADQFFSHRRDGGHSGRQLAFITLAPPWLPPRQAGDLNSAGRLW